MENLSSLKNKQVRTNNSDAENGRFLFGDKTGVNNPVLKNILSEGGDDFYNYLSWIGLSKDPNLMVLSSSHHYYYDHNDLLGIKTLVNLKKLNQVKHLESFLHILYRILPAKAYFVGCFRNCSQNTGTARLQNPAGYINGIMNIYTGSTERSLTKRSVTTLLEEHGFKLTDITDINGITYFWAQSTRRQGA
jgi:predicted transcriptional regulator with HTH domain